jgi:tetratricopeptide (TPR) repeat protein
LNFEPQNQDLYLHLDDLYKVQGLIERRQQLLAKIKMLEEVREDVHKLSILILVDLGRYEEALEIMQTEKFVPLEMDQSFHNLYVQALMQRAEVHSKSGQLENAITDYKKALEYPENLGVGKPTTMSQAHIYYQLGLTYEKLGRFQEALSSWRSAASEHHPHGAELFQYVQMSLDKLSRYSELGFES